MPFPTKVNKTTATSRHGALATSNPTSYAAGSPIAADGGVVAGNFVFYSGASNSDTSYQAQEYTNAQPTETTAPTGIVSAEALQTYISWQEESTMTLSAGTPLDIFTMADIYAHTDTAVTVNSIVYANTTTGAIEFTSSDDNIATNWYVARSAAAGDLCIISNRAKQEITANEQE